MKPWSMWRDPWFIAHMAIAVLTLAGIVTVGVIAVTHDDSPGPEWVHDRGSIYWSCTDSGRALIRDTDTGSTFLDRDDRKCDAGG